MNNSLWRIIDGMAAALRHEVIPQLGSEFARGQAFGVIYLLNSLALRTSWSPAFLAAQIETQLALRTALAPLLAGTDAPPLPEDAADALDVEALEACRDDNEARICALIEWQGHAALDAARAAAVEARVRDYLDQALKHELQTSAKPMFAEMSSGEG